MNYIPCKQCKSEIICRKIERGASDLCCICKNGELNFSPYLHNFQLCDMCYNQLYRNKEELLEKKRQRDKGKTIAEIIKEILIEHEYPSICWGDVGVIHECFDRANLKPRKYKQDLYQAVLNGLEGSSLFEKDFLSIHIGGRKRRIRLFVLIKNKELEKKNG